MKVLQQQFTVKDLIFSLKNQQALQFPYHLHKEKLTKLKVNYNFKFYIKKLDPTKKILMTATEWDMSTMNPAGWWMSEKYDGMRLYWSGSQFFTRQGNVVKAPENILKQMPKIALDGEIW
jgi:ATP-dependent DNA ligase